MNTETFDYYYNLNVTDSQGVPMMPRDLVKVTNIETDRAYYNVITMVTPGTMELDSLSSMQGSNIVGNTYKIHLNENEKYEFEVVQGNFGGISLDQRKAINSLSKPETVLLAYVINHILDKENSLWKISDLTTDEEIFGTTETVTIDSAVTLAEKIQKLFKLPVEAIPNLDKPDQTDSSNDIQEFDFDVYDEEPKWE